MLLHFNNRKAIDPQGLLHPLQAQNPEMPGIVNIVKVLILTCPVQPCLLQQPDFTLFLAHLQRIARCSISTIFQRSNLSELLRSAA